MRVRAALIGLLLAVAVAVVLPSRGSAAPGNVAPPAAPGNVAAPVAAAPVLPAGFSLLDYPTGQPAYNLTNFFFTEDGGLLTTGKDGRITFAAPGSAPRTIGTVPAVKTNNDNGLLGLEPANDYATSGRIFLLYTKLTGTGGLGMLEEWVASPPSAPTTARRSRVVLDGAAGRPALTQNSKSHAIGDVAVAPDDSLFVSVGDEASYTVVDPLALRALDRDDPRGKILRIQPDGRGVPTNPFYDAANPSSWRSRVYAMGFRNPFRFAIDPRNGDLYAGDVGWRTHEEVNRVLPGRSYGWPCNEGNAKTSGYSSLEGCAAVYAQPVPPVAPLSTYAHAGGQASVVAGTFYQGNKYPAAYRDAFFFGDYSRQQVWTLRTDPAGALTRAPESRAFGTGAGGPVAFGLVPDGDVAFADIVSGKVRRLAYAPGNRAPAAVATADVDAATRTVTFSAADSYDLDGDVLSYSWDFGDGTTGSGVTTRRTYAAGGSYSATLTVRDQLGATARDTVTIRPANNSPTLTLQAPPASTRHAVGTPVRLSARGADPEDGELRVTWRAALLHCPSAGSCHVHPEPTVTGPTYSAPFTDHGSDTTMQITAEVTDSAGATTTATYDAKPDMRTLSVRSPAPVSINGEQRISAPITAGGYVSVEAPSSYRHLRFVRWSNGQARNHSLTMPARDVELTAAYESAIDVKYRAFGGSSSQLGAPVGPEYDVAGGRARGYAGGRILWSPASGAHATVGAIRAKYDALGGPAAVGFPFTDELRARDGVGRFNDLTGNRSIYWTSATKARLIKGAIRTRWVALGAGSSCLGYPRTDEQATSYGAISYFQRGSLSWSRSSKQTTVRCS